MTRDIAHGRVVIDVDTQNALAELENTKAQVRKALADIDRMDADVEIGVDKHALRRGIAQAKAEIKALEGEKIELEIREDKEGAKALSNRIKRLKKELKELETVDVLVKVDDRELDELAAKEKKLETQRRKDADARHRAQSEYLKQLKAQSAELQRQGVIQQRALNEDKRRTIEAKKHGVELEKLRAAYAKLHAESIRANRSAMFGDPAAINNARRITAELELQREKITQLGGEYRDMETDSARRSFDTHESNKSLSNMLRSLSSIRLQMGFFSATLRQTAAGFTLLGPIIFGIAGQIVSFIGVLGTGLAGALAVSTAGVIGFGGAALGVGLILKPMIADLQDAKKASDAYGDAVRKYGKNSSEAQTAQEKLNKTLGDIGPEARQGFEQLGQMSDRWNKLTAGNRTSFFDTFGKGIKLASSYLPMFARESNKTFKTAMAAGDEWIDLFDSPEARTGIQAMLSGFRAAIPGLNSGFMSLAKSVGSIGASASRWLQPLSEGFANWADNIFKGLDSGGLDGRIDRIVNHMRAIGRFAQSAGSMLAAFFNAGANEGATMLQTLTGIFDKWTAWMNSARGQSGLAEFFSTANQIGSQFIATLGNIGLALFEFSTAFAPLSQGFVSVIQGVTRLVAAIMGLSAARTVVTAIGGALAGAFLASKIMAAVQALAAFRTALMAVGAASAATSLVSMINPIVMMAAIVGGAALALSSLASQASNAESALDTLADATARTKQAIDDLAGIEASMATASIGLATAKSAESRALMTYKTAVDKYGAGSKQAQAAQRAYTEAVLATQSAQNQLNQSTSAHSRNIRQNYAKANAEVVDLLKDQADAEEKLQRAKELGGTDSDLYDKRLADLRSVNASLAKAQQLADKYAKAVERAELNSMRAGKQTANITQDIGAAWGRLSNIPFFSGQFGNKFAKIVDPDQAATVVRLVDSLRAMGKLGAAKNVLKGITDFDPKSINEAIAKLRQVRGEAQKGGKAIITAQLKKGQVEKDLGSIGKGKTATVNTKANTKAAERDLSKLSGKQLAARLTIRGNNSDAMSKLNAVQRARLTAKLVSMKANPAAVVAAINFINNKKISPKTASFKADTGDAEAGNKKVQGFKNKSVDLTAKWTGASEVAMAQSSINSVQGKTVYLDVITRRSGGGSAAGGPSVYSAASGGETTPRPAQQRLHAKSAERADTRAARPGVYRRPTLLVGEENRKEYVISTNDSYRGANIGYLRAAANEFGYDISPIEMAAGGKKGGKYKPLKGMKQRKARKYPRYDYLSGKVSFWDEKAGTLETKRTTMLEAGATEGVPSVQSILDAHINEKKALLNLQTWMRKAISGMVSATGFGKAKGSSDKERKWGNKVLALKARLKKRQGTRPKGDSDKAIKAQSEWDKTTSNLQDALSKAQAKRDRFRDRTGSLNSEIGRFKRELEQQMPGRLGAVKNDIMRWQYIKDGKIDDPTKSSTGSGGSDTPYGIQLGQLDAERYEMFKQYGSNVAPLGAGAVTGGIPGAVAGYSASGAAPSAYAAAGGPGPGLSGPPAPSALPSGKSGFGGTTVNQTINMQTPPPDPHSFSKQLGWEAAAMLG